MHSDIIQLETSPISEVGRITTDADWKEWFLENVADYVKEEIEYHDQRVDSFIDYLQSCGPFVEVYSDGNEKWIVFKEGFIQAYFERVFRFFKEDLENLVKKASVDALINKYEMECLLFPLNESTDSKFGPYISSEETGLLAVEDFVRHIKANQKYYIGGTLDYHF